MKKTARYFVLGCFMAFLQFAGPPQCHSEVNINIGINTPLPKAVIAVPPSVVVIPGTYVYMATDIDVEILFFQGRWYRPNNGHWYASIDYNGPWTYVMIEKVPSELLRLPMYYRDIPPGQQRIPYGQLKKNWKAWEKEKRWERAEHGHGGRHGQEGGHREEKHRGKGKHRD